MNRYYLLLLLLFLASIRGLAQTDFAPPGAHWYNDGALGQDHYHSYTDGETTVNGKTCRIIRREALTGSVSNSALYSPLFVYNSDDTVFFYNSRFNSFTPLFIFNVHDGDTIRIPEPGQAIYTADTFVYRVDSVRMVQYDTSLLKTVFTTSIDPDIWDSKMAYSSYKGRYIEKIGGLERGIYPECEWCPIMDARDWRFMRHLWCYSDPTTSIKLIAGECDPPVSVTNTEMGTTVIAWPNPASDFLHIEAPVNGTVVLLSPDGRTPLCLPVNAGETKVDISSLWPGIYILRITTSSDTRTKRIYVMH